MSVGQGYENFLVCLAAGVEKPAGETLMLKDSKEED